MHKYTRPCKLVVLVGQSRHWLVSYVSFQYVPGAQYSHGEDGVGRYSPGKQDRVGACVGEVVGCAVGSAVGWIVGTLLGRLVGWPLGTMVGAPLGWPVG